MRRPLAELKESALMAGKASISVEGEQLADILAVIEAERDHMTWGAEQEKVFVLAGAKSTPHPTYKKVLDAMEKLA